MLKFIFKTNTNARLDMLQPSMKGGRGSHHNANANNHGNNNTARGPVYGKLMMSQDEIETIIHMQHAQLHSNHPYTDDYYYYQLQKRRGSQPLTRDEPPDIIRHHKPLCESTPTRTFPPKKIINDPLAGSLGRIPSHNVRCVLTPFYFGCLLHTCAFAHIFSSLSISGLLVHYCS